MIVDGIDAPLENSFEVYAPTDYGFFGLKELEAFCRLTLEPYAKAGSIATLVMDFSGVRVWDIAALLWLVVGMDHYRRDSGLLIKLRLPEERFSTSGENSWVFDRSADFLRRWRFDRALRNIDTEVSRLLVPEQSSYFDPPEPRRYYLVEKRVDESRLEQTLISRSLTEIRNLSDPSFTGSAPISPDKISQCIREFQAERIGDILAAQCGIDKRKADLFADHLLTEALLNVQEHPNATIGMLSISVSGNGTELILTIVDNGNSIPSTIFQRYKESRGAEFDYTRSGFDVQKIGQITDYATQPGITSKTGELAQNAGMGLTYIKEDTLNIFKGGLAIISDGAKVLYKAQDEEPIISAWPHAWRGNLLRIAIPMPKTSSKVVPVAPVRNGL